jgi:hypothetical protein
MPKFNRQQLAEAVTVALASHRSEWEDTQARKIAEHDNAARKWVETHGESWRLAALAIGRKARAGKPILREDLPYESGGFNDRVQVFSFRAPVHDYAPPGSLAQLAGVLAVLDEEIVTTTTLKELGVNSEALRQALHHIKK